MREERKREGWSRRRGSSTARGASLHRDNIWSGRWYNIRLELQWKRRGGRGRKGGASPRHDGRVGRGDVAAVVRLVRHLEGEGGARGGGEGAGLAGAAGVVVRALGGGHAAGTGAQVGRAGVTLVVVIGEGGARTPHATTLQGEDRAVRRRRRAGLCRHLLVRRQLERSQKTCEDRNISSEVASTPTLTKMRLVLEI